jgi:predicted Fe-Mo cluster-binding NifX family protein
MKIAIPTDGNRLEDMVAQHFGRCENYLLLDENGRLSRILKNTSEHMGGTGLPPELLKKNGADVLICAGLGPRAIELSAQVGLKVFTGPPVSASELFSMWKSGKLREATAESACKHHSD